MRSIVAIDGIGVIDIAILAGLRRAGIDIPYPQRVLRIDSLPEGLLPSAPPSL